MAEAGSVKEEVRRLLRECRVATLSTLAEGQPFGSLVTPATLATGELLLLLSDLAEHTRHLRAEPRCNLLVVGQTAEENPQTAPRVSIAGWAAVIENRALMERYLAVHPYAELYASFDDFHLWRFTPVSALFVGGFARAARLAAADLTDGAADRPSSGG
jgi:putative heme iron utilization protein